MKLKQIDNLIAELAEDFSFPLTQTRKRALKAQAKNTKIPMYLNEEAWATLRLARCYEALTTLRAASSAPEEQT